MRCGERERIEEDLKAGWMNQERRGRETILRLFGKEKTKVTSPQRWTKVSCNQNSGKDINPILLMDVQE